MIGKKTAVTLKVATSVSLPQARSLRPNFPIRATWFGFSFVFVKGNKCTSVTNQKISVFILIHFRYIDGITYFFKGSDYYRFNDATRAVDLGYPRSIASFWKGVPDNLDTVLSASNGHTYFFKDNLFYRFNNTAEQVDIGYPKSIALWRGILYKP